MIKVSLNKQQLRYWAIVLEQELHVHRGRSKNVAELCEYQALADVIDKAKTETIVEPVELTSLGYYFFETHLRHYERLSHALTCFSLLLEGFELPLE